MFQNSNNWEVISNDLLIEKDALFSDSIIWKDSCGPLAISRIDTKGTCSYRLWLGEDIAVDVHPNRRIIINSSPDVAKTTLDHFLADQVFPRVMAHDGDFILHAGAVRTGDGAILVMGSSGRGKSTLVTSFDHHGCALLGDDAMVISWHEDRPCAKSVYPSLRLLPDSIEALFSDPITTTPVAHYTAKQRVNVPLAGTDAARPLPIKAIFAIVEPAAGGQINLRRLTIAQACIAFVESSFALDPTDTKRARDRLEGASALARRVPTFELSYPRDYARLSEVREAILNRLDKDELA